ncbi:MAG: ROK family protein, partial [Spirochaetales bacterium]|nr:ROK family protein [Spirochaetales bacterium]
MERIIFGIDMGSMGIKGAPVDVTTGKMIVERLRIQAPKREKPKTIARRVRDIVTHFEWKGSIGIGFPAAIKNGKVMTAANIDRAWIGKDIKSMMEDYTACPVKIINDADAAGIAVMSFDTGRITRGTVMVVSVGTGLGTTLFVDGELVPNTELGHLEIGGIKAEKYASESAKKKDNLTYRQWAKRFNRYLKQLVKLFWPDKIILSGNICKNRDKFEKYIKADTEISITSLQNNAG